jgi:sorbitol-specific phosphotransferase system component IIA
MMWETSGCFSSSSWASPLAILVAGSSLGSDKSLGCAETCMRRQQALQKCATLHPTQKAHGCICCVTSRLNRTMHTSKVGHITMRFGAKYTAHEPMHTSEVGHITMRFGANYAAHVQMLLAAICHKKTSCKQLMLVLSTAAAAALAPMAEALITMHSQCPCPAQQAHNTAAH